MRLKLADMNRHNTLTSFHALLPIFNGTDGCAAFIMLIMDNYSNYVSHGRLWWFCWSWKIMMVLLVMEDYDGYAYYGRLGWFC